MYDERRIKNECEYLVNKFPERDCDFYRTGLAVGLVRGIVGLEWANQVLFPNDHKTLNRVNRETVTYMESVDLGFNYQERSRHLACALYCIQDKENFSEILKKIQNGDRKLGYIAEIEVGYFLSRRGIDFKYVISSEEKGRDFDIKISDSINCEIKHKLESTDFSEKGLSRTLSEAKDQVPIDEPAIIFVKIPNEWTRVGCWEKISECCDRRLAKSTNLIGIMLLWQREVRPGIFCWMFHFEKSNFNPTRDEYDDFTQQLNLSSKELWSSNIVDDSIRKYIKKCKNF